MIDDHNDHDDRIPVGTRTPHGSALLMPDLDQPAGWILTLNDSPQSYVDLNNPTHLEFEYTERLAHHIDLAAPDGKPITITHLGGGALTLPRYTHTTRPGSTQTVIEYDQQLAQLVLTHLPLPPHHNITLTIGDAREELTHLPDNTADILIADVFGGAQVPAHLTTTQFLHDAARHLKPTGTYTANLADGNNLTFLRTQAATLQNVFPHTAITAEPSAWAGRRFGNFILTASMTPLPLHELTRRAATDQYPARLITGPELTHFTGDAQPVTDTTATPSPLPPGGSFKFG